MRRPDRVCEIAHIEVGEAEAHEEAMDGEIESVEGHHDAWHDDDDMMCVAHEDDGDEDDGHDE